MVLESQTSCIYNVQDLFSTSLQVLYFWFYKKNIKNWKLDMKAWFYFGIQPIGRDPEDLREVLFSPVARRPWVQLWGWKPRVQSCTVVLTDPRPVTGSKLGRDSPREEEQKV